VKVQAADSRKFDLRAAREKAKIQRHDMSHFMGDQTNIYKFGPFELRCRTRELYKQGIRLKLRPQPMQVLRILAERAGDVVTREELHELLWAKETFVDFEHGLNTSIKELRATLNDSANAPRYVETLPKLGYRMIVPVKTERTGVAAETASAKAGMVTSAAPGVEDTGTPAGARPRGSRFWIWAIAAGVAVALLLGIAGYVRWWHMQAQQPAASRRLMLAVLPFENLTGDQAQEYFADGLTEEMIAQLGHIDAEKLGVIARTSVVRYKGSGQLLQSIGRDLGVQYVLEGSVRRDADKVRVSAQLIRVGDQSPVWGKQYDRELSNVLALQGEIAQEIAGEIRLSLDGTKNSQNASKHQTTPEAYDLYLRGLYFWHGRSTEGLQRATEYFQQAVEKDPQYARAYAGLADSYALLGEYILRPPSEVMPKARAAALRAIELDPTLAEGHASLAVVAQNYDWDWKLVEAEYKKAIELDPNYATAHHWYAESLALTGRFDEAIAEIERARQLDPLSLIVAADRGAIFYFARRYDQAIEQFRSVLEMDPGFGRGHIIALAYLQKGMNAEALQQAEKWDREEKGPWNVMMLAYISGGVGKAEEARAATVELEKMYRAGKADAIMMTSAYIGEKNSEKAIEMLQKAYERHTISTALKVDAMFDPLRGDARFRELLRRMNFE
jgi:TolB-like protein/DNA-binding winged helix-turn-helix (wHTH) protein/Tfp pilus assembly protein PilF